MARSLAGDALRWRTPTRMRRRGQQDTAPIIRRAASEAPAAAQINSGLSRHRHITVERKRHRDRFAWLSGPPGRKTAGRSPERAFRPRVLAGRLAGSRRDRPEAGSRAAEAGGQHVELGGIGAARRRLDVAHLGEVALEVGQQRRSRCRPAAPWRRTPRPAPAPRGRTRRPVSTSATMRRWSVAVWPVALAAMSDSTTSAGPPSVAFSRSGALGVEEVHHLEIDAGDRRHVQEVDRHHPALARRPRRTRSRRHLAPAAGRGAEIDDALAALEEAVLVVDLDQLEGGARAVALALGARRRRGR